MDILHPMPPLFVLAHVAEQDEEVDARVVVTLPAISQQCTHTTALPSVKMVKELVKNEIMTEKRMKEDNAINVWGKRPRVQPTCHTCDFVFDNEYLLEQHMNEHLKGKNFLCTICMKMFSQKANMEAHFQQVHIKAIEYKCELCGKNSSCKHNLKKHMDKTHAADDVKGKLVQCKICFTDMRGDMARHMRTALCQAKGREMAKTEAASKTENA